MPPSRGDGVFGTFATPTRSSKSKPRASRRIDVRVRELPTPRSISVAKACPTPPAPLRPALDRHSPARTSTETRSLRSWLASAARGARVGEPACEDHRSAPLRAPRRSTPTSVAAAILDRTRARRCAAGARGSPPAAFAHQVDHVQRARSAVYPALRAEGSLVDLLDRSRLHEAHGAAAEYVDAG